MIRYYVFDTPKNCCGDWFMSKPFETLEAANRQADYEWSHLTKREKYARSVYVAWCECETEAEAIENPDIEFHSNSSCFEKYGVIE